MLKIERLSKIFGELVAVNQVSLEVNAGEIVGLLGPNGAGKTTTIRCVASILRPTSGHITIGGHDIVHQASMAKQLLAYVPEVPHCYEMLTVWEHLRFVAAAYDTESEMGQAEGILKRLDLWEKRNQLSGSLSKGMRQKLACACAFVHRARVFCFDEPLIGIDPRGARELKDLLTERRAAGDAILVSTHILDTVEKLCDRIVIMHRGQVIAAGTVAEVRSDSALGDGATLEDVFLDLTSGNVAA